MNTSAFVLRCIPHGILCTLASLMVCAGLPNIASSEPGTSTPKPVKLRMVFSKDGTTFQDDDRVFMVGASAPGLIRLPGGAILAVFDLPPESGEETETLLAVSRSENDGRSWSAVERIRLDTRGVPLRRARHGSFVTERGGRRRLFFTCEERGRVVIRNALTRNGVDYRLDNDLRIPLPRAADAHAVAFELGGQLHLVTASTGGPADGETWAWFSQDRRRFMRLGPVPLRDAVFLGSVESRGSRARAFLSSADGIRGFVTKNGRDWKPERALCLAGGWDPAVIRLRNGSTLMLYGTHAGDGEEPPLVQAQEPDRLRPEPTTEEPESVSPPEPDGNEPTELADAGTERLDVEGIRDGTDEAPNPADQTDAVAWSSGHGDELEPPADDASVDARGFEPEPEPTETLPDETASDEHGEERIEAPGAAIATVDARNEVDRSAHSNAEALAVLALPESIGSSSVDALRSDGPVRPPDETSTSDRGPSHDQLPQDPLAESGSHEHAQELEERADGGDATEDAPPVYDWSEHNPADFVPKPDFETEINYFEWYETQVIQASDDNAYEAYAEIIPDPFDEPDRGPELPELHDLFNDWDRDRPPAPWSPEDHPEWEASNIAAEGALAKFREASTYDKYTTPVRLIVPKDDKDTEPLLINLLLPQLSSHRELARATMAAAWRTGADGKVPSTTMLDAIRTILRTARHLASGATLIEELVAISERNLIRKNVRWAVRQGILSSAEELRTALDLFTRYDRIVRDPLLDIREEHAATMQTTQYVFQPVHPGAPPRFRKDRGATIVQNYVRTDVDIGKITQRLEAMTPDDIRETVERLNEYYVDIADLLRTGYPKARATDVAALFDRYGRGNTWAELLLPDLSRIHRLRARDEAARRATRLVLAMHLFKAENERWPKSLDEFPGLDDPAARIDPFTGKEFAYRMTGEGPRLYSLSENQRDDGGVHAPKWDDLIQDDQESDDYVFWPPQQAGSQ